MDKKKMVFIVIAVALLGVAAIVGTGKLGHLQSSALDGATDSTGSTWIPVWHPDESMDGGGYYTYVESTTDGTNGQGDNGQSGDSTVVTTPIVNYQPEIDRINTAITVLTGPTGTIKTLENDIKTLNDTIVTPPTSTTVQPTTAQLAQYATAQTAIKTYSDSQGPSAQSCQYVKTEYKKKTYKYASSDELKARAYTLELFIGEDSINESVTGSNPFNILVPNQSSIPAKITKLKAELAAISAENISEKSAKSLAISEQETILTNMRDEYDYIRNSGIMRCMQKVDIPTQFSYNLQLKKRDLYNVVANFSTTNQKFIDAYVSAQSDIALAREDLANLVTNKYTYSVCTGNIVADQYNYKFATLTDVQKRENELAQLPATQDVRTIQEKISTLENYLKSNPDNTDKKTALTQAFTDLGVAKERLAIASYKNCSSFDAKKRNKEDLITTITKNIAPLTAKLNPTVSHTAEDIAAKTKLLQDANDELTGLNIRLATITELAAEQTARIARESMTDEDMLGNEEAISALTGMIEEISDHLSAVNQCNVSISDPEPAFLAIQQKETALTTATTNLTNYKNDPLKGSLVAGKRYSITTQETEKTNLLGQMPTGSTVTATSTAAVNNARIAANKVIINKTTTPTATKTSLTAENTNITRINTLNTQLTPLYNAAAFVALKTAFNNAQTARDAAVGPNGSIKSGLEAQRTQIAAQATCKNDFATWWNTYYQNNIQGHDDLFTLLSFITPRAYADATDDALKSAEETVARLKAAKAAKVAKRPEVAALEAACLKKMGPDYELKTTRHTKYSGFGRFFDTDSYTYECVHRRTGSPEERACWNFEDLVNNTPFATPRGARSCQQVEDDCNAEAAKHCYYAPATADQHWGTQVTIECPNATNDSSIRGRIYTRCNHSPDNNNADKFTECGEAYRLCIGLAPH